MKEDDAEIVVVCGDVKVKIHTIFFYIKELNSVALVRKRAIPTERPPLIGEFSANFCG
jgi:hypothetical protein